jgi:hypothetical protein
MRILIFGKYPPLQGGVSSQVYCTAFALAESGHEVHVVTNSVVSSGPFTEYLVTDDHSRIEGKVADGSVHVYRPEPLRVGSYTPGPDPMQSQLFGIGSAIAQDVDVDCVIGWYLEPFGTVAAHIASVFDLPLGLVHAGSDIGRLALNRDLRRAFQWAISRCSLFVSPGCLSPCVSEALDLLNVTREKRTPVFATALPSWFRASPGFFDWDELIKLTAPWYQLLGIQPKSWATDLFKRPPWEESPPCPVVGTYGKVGETKGTFDLIVGLRRLADRGIRFIYTSLVAGWPPQIARLIKEVNESSALRDCTLLLPPIAPWNVPTFLRRCNITCFLERGFLIPFHGPMIPREILSSASTLMCSAEIADKQLCRASLVDGKNYCRVDDPRDHESLFSRLERLVSDVECCHTIGKHGQYLSRFIETELPERDDYCEVINSWITAGFCADNLRANGVA